MTETKSDRIQDFCQSIWKQGVEQKITFDDWFIVLKRIESGIFLELAETHLTNNPLNVTLSLSDLEKE